MWLYLSLGIAGLVLGVVCVVLFCLLRKAPTVCRHVPMHHPSAHVATTQAVDFQRPPMMVDEVPCGQGHRILVKHQKDEEDNGVYEVGAQGWTRNTVPLLMGSWIWVTHGSTHGQTLWTFVLREGRHDRPAVSIQPALQQLVTDLPRTKQHSQVLECGDNGLRWKLNPMDGHKVRVDPHHTLPVPRTNGEYWCWVGEADNWCMMRVFVRDKQWLCDRSSYFTQGASPPQLDAHLHLKASRPQWVRWDRC